MLKSKTTVLSVSWSLKPVCRSVHHRARVVWRGSDGSSDEGPSDRGDDAGGRSAGPGRPRRLLHWWVWQDDGRRPHGHPRGHGAADHLHCQGQRHVDFTYLCPSLLLASLSLPLQVPGQGLACGAGCWLPDGVSDPVPLPLQYLLSHWFMSRSLAPTDLHFGGFTWRILLWLQYGGYYFGCCFCAWTEGAGLACW